MTDSQPLSSNQTQVIKANQRRETFAGLLREMFQLNQPELDFGLYRIMHARKDDINRFIERDLPRITQEAFASFASSDKAELQRELAKAVAGARALEVDPDSLPKVQQLKAQLNDGFDLAREEGEVYDALVTFFKRYYDEGDFLSRRVYKNGTYAIPYQGEEVVLHWANKDQYYIKSSETLRDYSFRLNTRISETDPNPMRVHFKLVDADAGAQNNNKESDSSKRVFIPDAEQPFELIEGEANENGQAFQELQLRFVFRAATLDDWQTNNATLKALSKATAAAKKKPPVQGVLVSTAVEWLLSTESQLPVEWQEKLALPYTKANGEQAEYSQLQGQLNNYTKKNSFDYFIHKDLGGFLTRELDFYIKNELLDWDDLASLKHNTARLAPLLSKIEVIRTLGEKIIAFLAQLENFQKKLWLKKKFVTDTQYCITLDRLADHDELLALVFDNRAQRDDWANLYALDLEQLAQDLQEKSVAQLLEQPKYRFLMLDTRHFDEAFKAQLLATIDDLDEQCDGLLVHSENFQALNLLQERYKEQVKCIYIDPPYNTGNDGFLYKDSLKHSSWATAVMNSVSVSRSYLKETGIQFASIDDSEMAAFKVMLDGAFGEQNFIANIIWEKNFSPRNTAKYFSENHDYLLCYAKNAQEFNIGLLPRSQEAIDRYSNPDSDPRGVWTSGDLTARNFYSEGTYEVTAPGGNTFRPAIGNYWRVSKVNFSKLDKEGRIYWGESKNNMPRLKRYLSEVKDGVTPVTIWNYKDVGHTQEAKRELVSAFSFESSGEVFNTVKPTKLINRVITTANLGANDTVLDFYAGSGSTAHAVVNSNRSSKSRRKFVLVEMGEYFDRILKPRIQKVVYAENWKAGAPVSDDTGSYNGVSHCFKTIRLESYEDALGNLALQRDKGQQTLLEAHENSELDKARQSYVMNYMLEVETRGSASLLNTKLFTDPTQYQLNVRSASGDETKAINVDLLESFNYLLGLTVEHIAAPLHFDAEISQTELGRWQAQVKRSEQGAWWFRTVYGVNRAGQKVLVVWRNLPSVLAVQQGANDEKALLKDNAVLDAVLIEKLNIRLSSSQDDEVDILYVNGDHNIAIPKNRRGEMMKEARIQLIEEAFHRLMFANTESSVL
ncbi:site-specific DNA-methyltransferase [Pontibacterium sp.]|uniref:site-specific DNA-methyltransferase n=1 Tax=Pontibacterium sp. TaxID=2036026 RepID=UPI00351648A6